MRFVCTMAWADLRIADEERQLIASLILRLDLEADERASVAEWLKTPPHEETVDPTRIPREHRELFRATLLRTVEADGSVSDEERRDAPVRSARGLGPVRRLRTSPEHGHLRRGGVVESRSMRQYAVDSPPCHATKHRTHAPS